MNLEQSKEIWKKEEEFLFKGWDFYHINSRTKEEKLPYIIIVYELRISYKMGDGLI